MRLSEIPSIYSAKKIAELTNKSQNWIWHLNDELIKHNHAVKIDDGEGRVVYFESAIDYVKQRKRNRPKHYKLKRFSNYKY